jgi:hypothetical protein
VVQKSIVIAKTSNVIWEDYLPLRMEAMCCEEEKQKNFEFPKL